MTKQNVTGQGCPQGGEDGKVIVLIIILLSVAVAVAGCHCHKATMEAERRQSWTAKDSVRQHVVRWDSLWKNLKMEADTLDIWIGSSTLPYTLPQVGRVQDSYGKLSGGHYSAASCGAASCGNDSCSEDSCRGDSCRGDSCGGESYGYTYYGKNMQGVDFCHIRAVNIKASASEGQHTVAEAQQAVTHATDSTTMIQKKETKEATPRNTLKVELLLMLIIIGIAATVVLWFAKRNLK